MTFLPKSFLPEILIKKVNSFLTLIEETDIKRLVLKDRGVFWKIEVRNIIYIERVQRKKAICIALLNEETGQLDIMEFHGTTLKYVLEVTDDKRELCRIHKSFAINPNKIIAIDYPKKLIHLKNADQAIPLGDAYKQNIKNEGDG